MNDFVMFDRAGWHNLYPVFIAADGADVIVQPRGFVGLYNLWQRLVSDMLGFEYLFDTKDLDVPFYVLRQTIIEYSQEEPYDI